MTQIHQIKRLCKIILVTATPIETKEVIKNLRPLSGNSEVTTVYKDQYTYTIGQYSEYNVIHVETGMGSVGHTGSIITFATAIDLWDPAAIIMVGIAFGKDRKTQNIGDVLVSEGIIQYNIQRVGKTSVVQRGLIPPSSTLLLDRLKVAARTWHHELSERINCNSKVIFGQLLSGETLIDNRDYRDNLLNTFPQCVGGEMEGAGLFAAAHSRKKEWIVVKGICDFADGNKKKNKKQNQQTAIEAAASLCEELLRQKDAFKDILLFPAALVPGLETKNPALTHSLINVILFDVFDRRAEDYYHERQSDIIFLKGLQKDAKFHYWFSGESGTGKTTLILRNLNKCNIDFKYISLIHCFNCKMNDLLIEINSKLIEICNLPLNHNMTSKAAIKDIILGVAESLKAIDSKVNKQLYIYIDEIPLSADDKLHDEFIKYISSIIASFEALGPKGHLKIILSSLFLSKHGIPKSQAKIFTRVKFQNLERWNRSEIQGLFDLCKQKLELDIPERFEWEIIEAAKGSPRFVKNILRDLMTEKVNSINELNDLIFQCQGDLGI